ncbi:hypothetical protein ACSBR2_028270 [Camellia fascicularis]
MADDGHEEKTGNGINSESCEHKDPNVGKENHNKEAHNLNLGEKDVDKEGNASKKVGRDEYYNESDLQVWKDRCLRRDGEMKGMANKLVDLQSVVNFMIKNNMMQLSFPLQDMLIPATKTDA